jgi:NitT/TauT family transport system substrate-binding protein
MFKQLRLMRFIGVLVLAFGASAMPSAAQQLTTIRMSVPPIDEAATPFYAQDLGYFKDAGLDVVFEAGLSNASAAVAALLGGSINVTASATVAVAAAHSHGIGLKVIAPGTLSTEDSLTDVIAVKKDSPLASGADLNGKTIGIIGLKSMQQVAAMAWVDKHGGDSATLKFLELPIPQLCPQVVAGRVDASLPIEPFVTGCKSDIRILGNVNTGIAPRFVSIVFVSTDDWLRANPATATRFVAALRRAAIWANAHRAESAAILARYAKLDPAVAASMARATYATTLDASSLQPAIDASARYGVIDKPFPASEVLWAAPR